MGLGAGGALAVIPPLAHFVWLTREFPWVNWIALSSAARHGGFEKMILHHSAELEIGEYAADLATVPGLELRPLDAGALLGSARLPPALCRALLRLYERLEKPAARSNVLRVALLLEHGGVYLDLDTVTVASLAPLRAAGVFCGVERVAFPFRAVQSGQSALPGREPSAALAHAMAFVRSGVREVLRRAPRGYRAFRAIERFYPLAANNAVLGAGAGHPFLRELLSRMAALPEWRALRRFALGTHLLQAALPDYDGDDLAIHGPAAFYPLGPEISQHWFRRVRRADPAELLFESTKVVHWYASLRTAEQQRELTRERIAQLAKTQPFSALATRYAL